MRIIDILRSKGSDVVTVDPRRTILEAIRMLVEHDIGALVVQEGGRPVGIVSERDVLRLAARGPEALAEVTVGEVMSTELITEEPGADLQHAMRLMTVRRVRHLPVTRNERLIGIVSIGDVVNALRSDTEETNRHLMAYISGAQVGVDPPEARPLG
jgi:CBS domain-containing protein